MAECPRDWNADDRFPVDAGGVIGGRSKFSEGKVGVGERPTACDCKSPCMIIGPTSAKTGLSNSDELGIWN